MAVTVFETLQNARSNVGNVFIIGVSILPLAWEQLDHAVTLLEKGYSLNDEVESLLAKYGDINGVPENMPVYPEEG